ncbi:ABC transporter substrate-binding protein [Prauserella muralis]|uniref:BMP family ABC transporter substrate-binding protein n=1 Tax=Prauserella muralis TaxID=588067 RepID=A0A2V4AZD5_9PSEU|nr:ABC transporter substrate-binding protein [Prauserella muralis]PXY27350.1 BMP family ABC transporter substrate-binding protein [Prauserella muralis]TWE22965.1 monosaccharide ABC transporter substrate-binding protein (CUT2 family) [Prauserella muralis]
MRMRKVVAAFAGAAMALGLAACGSDGGSGGGSGGDGPFIAIVSKGFQHQFWQAVKKGAEEEAAKHGARITFVGPATEQEVEEQMNMLTNELAKSPDALGFAALDSRAAAPLLQQAQSQDIPVIAFDSGVDSDVPVTTVATDNKAAAAEAAKHMAEELGGKGKVAMVVHDQTSKSGTDRRDGFKEWMQQNAPGITVLDAQYGGGDQLESANITKSIISANPDLKGIYASNEGSAIGVIKGVQESGKKGITVVGFDSGKAQIDAIKDGVMAGAVTQDPIDMGRQLVQSAIKAVNGEQLPKTIDTNFYWYDKSNVEDPKIQAVLYQ